jgi:alpha-ketoglutarate-dependent taurine dioxygenase
MATTTQVTVTPVTSNVGAVIGGLDVSRPLAADEVAAVKGALLEHGVVFFRNQELSDDQMGAFVSQFGQPIPEPFGNMMKVDAPPVGTTDLGGTKQSTSVWHTDTTFVPEPPGLTALRAVDPPAWGGDTCWSSMYAAYEALSAPMQEFLDGLTASHSMIPTLQRMGAALASNHEVNKDVYNPFYTHPLIRVHPETGRKSLYFSEAGVTDIVELTQAESDHIIALLREHCKSPDFAMRWHWSANDLAMWDNRCVQHYAVPDYKGRRIMQRVVTAGGRPVGPRG